MRRFGFEVIVSVLALNSLLLSRAADWPQFMGPNRDGISREQLQPGWDANGPETMWKKKVGEGFAGPIVVSNTVVLFQRQGTREVLVAYDLPTGEVKWQNEAPTKYRDDFGFDEGPRATPCYNDGRIYAVGAEGLVRCVDFASGKAVWTVNARAEYKMRKGFFGFAPSPLVAGGNLLLNLGGEDGAGIVALDKHSGKLKWKAANHEASYSSPTLFGSNSDRAVFLTREGLVMLKVADGKGTVEFPWRARMHASVNAASPIVVGDKIFLTASYDTGAVLLRWEQAGFRKIWSGDESLSAHYATPVHHDGHLYGFHGRQEMSPSFRCVELSTGRVTWSEDRFGAGTVSLAGGKLVILRETGELVLASPSPQTFSISHRAQILGDDTRAYPAISDGCFVGRDKSNLVCVRLE